MQQNAVIRKKMRGTKIFEGREIFVSTKKLNYFVILKEDFYGLT